MKLSTNVGLYELCGRLWRTNLLRQCSCFRPRILMTRYNIDVDNTFPASAAVPICVLCVRTLFIVTCVLTSPSQQSSGINAMIDNRIDGTSWYVRRGEVLTEFNGMPYAEQTKFPYVRGLLPTFMSHNKQGCLSLCSYGPTKQVPIYVCVV